MSEKKIPIDKICEYLGENLDSPFCQEIQEHIRKNPHCKIYLDSIKKTVFYVKTALGKEEECEDVLERLKSKVNNLLDTSSEKKDNCAGV